MASRVDFKAWSGTRYGRLVALWPCSEDNNKRWFFRCDCGALRDYYTGNVLSGVTRSCGCLNTERRREKGKNVTHGMKGSREYRIWSGMLSRCRAEDSDHKTRYFDRGISVCDRWLKFEAFFEDMGFCPPGGTIDRINNDAGYSPSNCRWADVKTQQNNRSTNVLIQHNGRTMTISQWADELAMPYEKLYRRIRILNWSFIDAVSTP